MPAPSATLATSLLTDLTAGVDFTLPDVDLTGPEFALPDPGSLATVPAQLTNADLTTGAVDGTGTFDVLMRSVKAHLTEEYNKGRITGEQYAKIHAELIVGAMQNSVAFLLGRDAAYWQAVKAQQDALAAQITVVISKVALETAKVQLKSTTFEMLTNKANYALTEIKLATESVQYDTAKFNLDNILPSQKALIDSQKIGSDDDNSIKNYTLNNILPAQKMLINEQTEAQRAQTTDTRTDLAAVTGLIGKQKDLYAQQIVSYKRDSETKIAKLFTDAWITQKTIDEGLLPPTGFNNASLDLILSTLKLNVQLDGLAHP